MAGHRVSSKILTEIITEMDTEEGQYIARHSDGKCTPAKQNLSVAAAYHQDVVFMVVVFAKSETDGQQGLRRTTVVFGK